MSLDYLQAASKMKKRGKRKKNFAKRETLAERIRKFTEGLIYISETDSDVVPFVGEKADKVDTETILLQTKLKPPVEERDFEQFFQRLTEMKDWYGDQEMLNANKFTDLKILLEQNLTDLKVFKVGCVQLDIYVVGLDVEKNLTGVQMKAVET